MGAIKLRLNRFSLWTDADRMGVMEVNVSEKEASISDTQDNLLSPRPIRSGKYKDYVIMGQAGRVGNAAGLSLRGVSL